MCLRAGVFLEALAYETLELSQLRAANRRKDVTTDTLQITKHPLQVEPETRGFSTCS